VFIVFRLMKRRLFMLALALCLTTVSHAQGEMSLFKAGSYQNILQSHQGEPFMLVFWSLDCAYCRGEFVMLSEAISRTPAFKLVLVATDSPQQSEELMEVIHESGLTSAELWVFAEAESERLRYEVDRHWYGELPRTYLFDAQHSRRVVSGAIKRPLLDEWLGTHHNDY
jgi:thiol-disulfide isomerase/thioredoxin